MARPGSTAERRAKERERAAQYSREPVGETAQREQRARALDVERQGPTAVTVREEGEPTKVYRTVSGGETYVTTGKEWESEAATKERAIRETGGELTAQEQRQQLERQTQFTPAEEKMIRGMSRSQQQAYITTRTEAQRQAIGQQQYSQQRITRGESTVERERKRLRRVGRYEAAGAAQKYRERFQKLEEKPKGKLRIVPIEKPKPKEEVVYKKELGAGFSIVVPKKTPDSYAQRETKILEEAPAGTLTKYRPVFRAEGIGEIRAEKIEESKAIEGKGFIPFVKRAEKGLEIGALGFAESAVKHPIVTGALLVALPVGGTAIGKITAGVVKKTLGPAAASVTGQLARKATGAAITGYFGALGAKETLGLRKQGVPIETAIFAGATYIAPILYGKVAGRRIAKRQLQKTIPEAKLAMVEKVKPVSPKELPVKQVEVFAKRPAAVKETSKFLRETKPAELLVGERPKLIVGGSAAQTTQVKLGRKLGDIDVYAAFPGLRARQLGKRLTKVGVKGIRETFEMPGEIGEKGHVFVGVKKYVPGKGIKMIEGKPYKHMVSFHTKEYRRIFPFKAPLEETPAGIKVIGIKEQAARKLEGIYKMGRAKDIPDFYKIIAAQKIGRAQPRPVTKKPPLPGKKVKGIKEIKTIEKAKEFGLVYPEAYPTAYPGAYPMVAYPSPYAAQYPEAYPSKYPRQAQYPKAGKYPRPGEYPGGYEYPIPGRYPRPGKYPSPTKYPEPGRYPRPMGYPDPSKSPPPPPAIMGIDLSRRKGKKKSPFRHVPTIQKGYTHTLWGLHIGKYLPKVPRDQVFSGLEIRLPAKLR